MQVSKWQISLPTKLNIKQQIGTVLTHYFPLLIFITEFREQMHYANSFYNVSGPYHSSGD
jgi:hypothetical protein